MTDYYYGYCTACQPEVVDNITVNNYSLDIGDVSAVQVNQVISLLTGSLSKYLLPYAPINKAGVMCFLSGASQRYGIDFTINGNILTFSEDLDSTYVVQVNYLSTTSGIYNTEDHAGETILWGASATLPDNLIACDATEVLITTYPALYAAIGTDFNDGLETAGYFRLPPNVSTDTAFISAIRVS